MNKMSEYTSGILTACAVIFTLAIVCLIGKDIFTAYSALSELHTIVEKWSKQSADFIYYKDEQKLVKCTIKIITDDAGKSIVYAIPVTE